METKLNYQENAGMHALFGYYYYVHHCWGGGGGGTAKKQTKTIPIFSGFIKTIQSGPF
jgi:hypothetical protein